MNYTVKEMPCKSGENDIYGLAYIPEAEGKVPAVILSHGYNSSHSHILDLAEQLAGSGIAAYCYDFCGGSSISKSGGRTTDMSIATEQTDLKNVIEMVKGCGFADSSRIFLYGESQGGFVSALTAAEMSEDIAGMVLLYPAFCIPDNWLGKSAEEMTEPFDFMGMTISRTFREGLPEYDVFAHIAAFEKPVLIIHGDADALVDVSYAQKAKDAFPDCMLEIYPDEGHGFSPDARRSMCGKAVEFFKNLV
ncbi:MAG: alpha/beta hydrolase [Oscillospiraceae bacterium]|nr:alpha/beta hydrolase [Oscillospiraceae bacterium]